MGFVFFHLLADRNLSPAAVLLEVADHLSDEQSADFVSSRLPAFAASFPCLIDNDHACQMPPEALAALECAGVRTIGCDLIFHSDEASKPVFPLKAEWMAGSWYLAPPVRLSGTPTASRTLSLRLLHLVATDADTHEIEAIFREDPVLAYHLLRLVNSLGVGVGRHISSFSQAIIILGRQQLKRWLNLMLFAANMNDYRAGMLMARVTVRARSMELLAALLGRDRTVQEAAFMCGMFSLLGVLFGMPLASVLAPLKLNESIAAGVLRHDGTLGQLLKIVEGVEQGRSDAIRPLLETANIGDRDLNEITLAAHEWMLNVIRDKQSDYDG